jgi:hypothetical protein
MSKKRFEQHVHDVAGNVLPAGSGRKRHTHCFETVTSEAIPYGDSHVHEVKFVTDIVDCHCHKFCGRTGPAIPTGFGDHIHVINSPTSYNDGHKHCTFVATSTEIPVRC